MSAEHTAASESRPTLDVSAIRAQFPILRQTPHGQPLVYLDSAATSHKPQAVVDAIARHYFNDNANIHRAVYQLGERATAAYEHARAIVARALNAASVSEVIFTRGATEAINLVAYSFARPRLQPGDEIVVSAIEHHANIVPWQLVAKAAGARVIPAPVDANGDLDFPAFEALLGPRTRLVAMVQVSNALGTVMPVAEVCAAARARGIPVLIDGAQAMPHGGTDVQALGADFYVFSGHKVYGPTGSGALWAKAEHLEAMPPWQGGGDMIETVSFTETTFAPPPARFEAGTPAIAEAVGLGAALEWLGALDRQAVAAHEAALTEATVAALSAIPAVRLIGTPKHRGAVVSFTVDGLHPQDVGTLLDRYGICVRVGHHCAQPALQCFGVDATVRASFGVYNTLDEVAFFADRLAHLVSRFT